MKAIRRLGFGKKLSMGASKCPDFFELDTGDFALIGKDVTSELRNSLLGDAVVGEDERVIMVPRKIITSAKNDIPNE